MKRRRPSTSAYNISNNSIAEPKVDESPPVIPNSFLRSNSIPSSCRSRRRQPTATATIRQLFIFYIFVMPIFEISSAATGTIFEDYKECRDHELFGNVSLICDPEHKLQRPTLRRLDSLLRDLQSKIDCECENGCVRGDGLTNRYIGLLLVTNSAKIDAAADGAVAESLNETSRRIFEDARLGDAQCDNGLLIIYIKDQQKLATYRGSDRFALLNDADMAKLHEIALSKGAASPAAATAAGGEDSVALQYLLSNYESQRGGGGGAESVLRAENWAPIIGLTVALVIVLLVLAALLALLFAKLCSRCCCCSCCASDEDAERKDKYYVAQQHHGAPSTYKTIEPIYIVTPTMSEHGGGLPPMSISAPLGVPPSSAHHYHHSSMHPQPNTRPSSVHSRRRYQNRHSVVQQQQHSPSSAVTNAMTDNGGGGAYSIYNSPLYGSSPQSPPSMPLPPLPPPPQMYVGGGGLSRGQRVSAGSAPIVTQSSRSRSLTPTSTHRTRVHPQHSVASTSTMQGGGGGGDGFDVRSPDQTLQNRRDKMNRNSTIMSRYSNATYYTAGGCNGSVVDATDHHHHYPTTMKNRPASTASNLQLIPSGSSQKQQPNTNNTDSTSASELEELGSPRLPFLDPFRKREVQTKKEFIS